MMIHEAAPSAELSPPGNGYQRGGSQALAGTLPANAAAQAVPPNTALTEQPHGLSIKRFTRTITFRLDPTPEQHRLLRVIAEKAAQVMNRHSYAKWGERNGWLPPIGWTPKNKTVRGKPNAPSLTKFERALFETELSSAISVGCERRVQGDWEREKAKVFYASTIPRYKPGTIPIDSGQRGARRVCGIDIVRSANGRIVVDLHLTEGARGAGWRRIRVNRTSEQEQFRAEALESFADGRSEPLGGRIRLERESGKVLLDVGRRIEIQVPPMGDRQATVSEFKGRLLVRIERVGPKDISFDLSRKLHTLKQQKANWDKARRAFSRRAMRSKGSARLAREKLANMSFSDWASEQTHSWSARIVRFCAANGVGEIALALIGADWPAYQLTARLKYKAQEAGMRVVEASLEQEPTQRAVVAVIKKRKRQAKKLGNAMREIDDQINPGVM